MLCIYIIVCVCIFYLIVKALSYWIDDLKNDLGAEKFKKRLSWILTRRGLFKIKSLRLW